MAKTGVIHGRFQVLHHDHLKYLLAGKARCDFLYVGITNPDPGLTAADEADAQRSLRANNPLTYFERARLVRAALTEAGVRLEEFMVVPFPINFPELYHYYVPTDATYFLTIYDTWGEKKLSMFAALGLRTEILWRKTPATKGLSSSEIRRLMAANAPWQHMVPPAAARLLEEWDIPRRLREMPK
jgi:nicotinamide-nucleotide adenylyltransferase